MAKETMTPQHKRLAQGERVGFKAGGAIPMPKALKTGIPESPVTKSKAANGIPGMKNGGGLKSC